MKPAVAGKNCAIVGGNAMIAAAKITGMTPAMLTRSGMYVVPPEVIRRPTMRFAYWIGIRRLALRDEHARDDDPARHDREEELLHRAAVQPRVDPRRGARQDRGEDEDRDAVADTALRDQLAHPHEERRARR